MENEAEKQELVNNIYDYAADLMAVQGKSSSETIAALQEKGLSEENAKLIVSTIEQ